MVQTPAHELHTKPSVMFNKSQLAEYLIKCSVTSHTSNPGKET